MLLGDLRSEEESDHVSIATLLHDEDLLDALILGEEPPETPNEKEANRAASLESENPKAGLQHTDAKESSIKDIIDANLAPAPQWDFSTTLSMGIGYKENVLFSAFNEQDSIFTSTELEATLFRLALADGWQFFGYFFAENDHYFDVDGLDDEWLAIALLQTHKKVGDWKFGLGGQYTFLEQAFSLSFEDLDLGSTKIVLNQFSLKPSIEYAFLKHAYVRLELPSETDRFEDNRQNYHEYGAHLTVGHQFKRGGKIEAVYRFEVRDYEERAIRNESGATLPGTDLEWEDHQWRFSLDYYLNAKKTWRSKSLLSLRRVKDNGSGYDDFWMYRARQKLTYIQPTWELSASASYSHYDYDTQTVESGNSNHRHRSRFSFGCDFEKQLAEDLEFTLSYRFEDYLSNVPDDVYSGSVISMALGYSF
jgi:hypothetical protein